MKLFVVRGAREYFYPFPVTQLEGLPGSSSGGAVVSPSLGWMRPPQALDVEDAPPPPPYHSSLASELEAQFRLDLVIDYLSDSVAPTGLAVLMFPEQPLTACGTCPDAVARIVERARERQGAEAVWSGWVSLGGGFDDVVLRGARSLAQTDDAHLAPRAASPLYGAMHRNWSYNVLVRALADAFARLDDVLAVGERPQALARELDELGARVRPGTTREQLDIYCGRLVRRQLGLNVEVAP
jgi:hypothetical protein